MKNQAYLYFIFCFILALINIEIVNHLDQKTSRAIAQQTQILGWIIKIEGKVRLNRGEKMQIASKDDALFHGDILKMKANAKVIIKCKNLKEFIYIKHSEGDWPATRCLSSNPSNKFPVSSSPQPIHTSAYEFNAPFPKPSMLANSGGNNLGIPSQPIYINNCFPERGEICLGERSQNVIILQHTLRRLGFFRGNVDGYYSPETKDAVVQLQWISGLKTTGFVDLPTRQALEKAQSPIKYGDYIRYTSK